MLDFLFLDFLFLYVFFSAFCHKTESDLFLFLLYKTTEGYLV